VAEADAAGALRTSRQEHLGRRGVGILLQEVVLNLPDVVNAEPIREFHLRNRILNQSALGILIPGLWQLVLIEQPEFHGVLPC
jgi:hypothetical protein